MKRLRRYVIGVATLTPNVELTGLRGFSRRSG